MGTPKRSLSFTSKKNTSNRPTKSPQATRPAYPTLTVSFVSIEVKHNGWPGEGVKATDLSLVLQLEDPDPAVPARTPRSPPLTFRSWRPPDRRSPRRISRPTRTGTRSSAEP